MRYTTLIGAILLASTQLRATTAGAARTNLIVLNVVDRASSSKEALNQAEHAVTRIFASAGLSLQWRDAPAYRAVPGAFAVTLLPDSGAVGLPEFPQERVLALSGPPPLRRILVNAERVRYSILLFDCSEGALLGHVIGHETFHALGLPHARRGLMRLSPQSTQGILDQTLSDVEVATIRAALRPDAAGE